MSFSFQRKKKQNCTNCETCYVNVHSCCSIALYKMLPLLLPCCSCTFCFSFTTLNNFQLYKQALHSTSGALIRQPPFIVFLCLALPSFNDHRQRGVLKNCYFIQFAHHHHHHRHSPLHYRWVHTVCLLIIDILQCRRMATHVVRVSGF